MSAQFGAWNVDGRPLSPDYIERASKTIVRFGPDGLNRYSASELTIAFSAFHITEESRKDAQPHRTSSGNVITWDGRLDNSKELRCQLRQPLASDCSDVVLVAAAYEKWGKRSFARLVGDWALSIWDPNRRLVILARDPIGVRPLYYAVKDGRITWSSVLEPLVLCADRPLQLSEEYIAGWLSLFPAAHLTPYVGIQAVPPACFVSLARDTARICKYWDFDRNAEIRFQTDAEYEEQFRDVFAEAVRRRLRSDRPVLAELSGGWTPRPSSAWPTC